MLQRVYGGVLDDMEGPKAGPNSLQLRPHVRNPLTSPMGQPGANGVVDGTALVTHSRPPASTTTATNSPPRLSRSAGNQATSPSSRHTPSHLRPSQRTPLQPATLGPARRVVGVRKSRVSSNRRIRAAVYRRGRWRVSQWAQRRLWRSSAVLRLYGIGSGDRGETTLRRPTRMPRLRKSRAALCYTAGLRQLYRQHSSLCTAQLGHQR